MPTTPESLRATIDGVKDLYSVVKTMKALAAVSIRQYERAVQSLAEYNRTVELGLQIVLQERYFAGEPIASTYLGAANIHNAKLGAIVFGSDRGLCGQFNEKIVTYARERLKQETENPLVAVAGSRAIPYVEAAGYSIVEQFSVPSSAAGITERVSEIVLAIEQWQEQEQIERIMLFYNQPRRGASYRPHSLQLLPLDPDWLRDLEQRQWSTSVLPTFTMDWQELFAALIREYFFVSLYRAFAASLASENASRLASMQSAQKNIEERLSDLNADYRRLRQSTITAELLDIVAGFEALTRSH
ncbi:F0F1 ATP synthase subunit gamma [Pleurocapsales cyanobacterium LEGE 06147]|nr:F0F1 ATP synthase subunit gamma [Pleurocapsales cyanobacterium LEGE 06147]